jgi:hypothetical protein
MEGAIASKCAEIKRHKRLVRNLLVIKDFENKETQCAAGSKD